MITTSAPSRKWKNKEKSLINCDLFFLDKTIDYTWRKEKKRMSISNSVWWIMQEGMEFTVDMCKISGVCSCTLNSSFWVHLTRTVCSTQQLGLDLHSIRGREYCSPLSSIDHRYSPLYGCARPSTLCACR